MKKILIALFALMPLAGFAQSNTTLTPEQQLEAAQKQLEAAQKAVEQAKANAEKAKKAADEAKAKAEAQAKAEREAKEKKAKEIAAKQAQIQAQIKQAQEEAARLNAEAERLNKEAQQIGAATTVPETKTEVVKPTAPAAVTTAVSTPKPAATTTRPAATTAPRTATATTSTKKYIKNKSDEAADITPYLAGAVPVVDGRVTFTLNLDVPGKSAKEIYDVVYEYLTELTDDDNQDTEGAMRSQVVVDNAKPYQVAARMCEWLVFQSNFISLDRSEFDYTLVATCSDNHLDMTLSRISYSYDKDRKTGFKTKAENFIVDEYGLSKHKDKLSRYSGKFRRATIDRKNEIFNGITAALQ